MYTQRHVYKQEKLPQVFHQRATTIEESLRWSYPRYRTQRSTSDPNHMAQMMERGWEGKEDGRVS